MEGREFIRKLQRLGAIVAKGRRKGGHCLATDKGRQATIPMQGATGIAVPFLKELCKQLGIDPQDVL